MHQEKKRKKKRKSSSRKNVDSCSFQVMSKERYPTSQKCTYILRAKRESRVQRIKSAARASFNYQFIFFCFFLRELFLLFVLKESQLRPRPGDRKKLDAKKRARPRLKLTPGNKNLACFERSKFLHTPSVLF